MQCRRSPGRDLVYKYCSKHVKWLYKRSWIEIFMLGDGPKYFHVIFSQKADKTAKIKENRVVVAFASDLVAQNGSKRPKMEMN